MVPTRSGIVFPEVWWIFITKRFMCDASWCHLSRKGRRHFPPAHRATRSRSSRGVSGALARISTMTRLVAMTHGSTRDRLLHGDAVGYRSPRPTASRSRVREPSATRRPRLRRKPRRRRRRRAWRFRDRGADEGVVADADDPVAAGFRGRARGGHRGGRQERRDFSPDLPRGDRGAAAPGGRADGSPAGWRQHGPGRRRR